MNANFHKKTGVLPEAKFISSSETYAVVEFFDECFIGKIGTKFFIVTQVGINGIFTSDANKIVRCFLPYWYLTFFCPHFKYNVAKSEIGSIQLERVGTAKSPGTAAGTITK